jgi:hypothetical protein
MTDQMIARLILEWWNAGEHTSARLDSLTLHFSQQYRTGYDELRSLVRSLVQA